MTTTSLCCSPIPFAVDLVLLQSSPHPPPEKLIESGHLPYGASRLGVRTPGPHPVLSLFVENINNGSHQLQHIPTQKQSVISKGRFSAGPISSRAGLAVQKFI